MGYHQENPKRDWVLIGVLLLVIAMAIVVLSQTPAVSENLSEAKEFFRFQMIY